METPEVVRRLHETTRVYHHVSDAVASIDDATLTAVITGLGAVRSALEACWLRTLAEIDRRGTATASGARDTGTYVAGLTGERSGAGKRDVELATKLAETPAITEALADGSLSKTKATELSKAVGASDQELAELVNTAAQLPADQVAQLVNQYNVEHGHQRARTSRLDITHDAEGATLHGQLDHEEAEWVSTATNAAADELGLVGVSQRERQAAGLVALSRFVLTNHDKPVTHRYGRPTLIVNLDIDALATRSGRSARTANGAYLSSDDARRLACDANIHRYITSGVCEPLDVGRKQRTIPPAMARAILARDQRCRYGRCSAKEWACEIHHVHHWTDEGETSVDNCVMLCWFHHKLVHRLNLSECETRVRLGPPPTDHRSRGPDQPVDNRTTLFV